MPNNTRVLNGLLLFALLIAESGGARADALAVPGGPAEASATGETTSTAGTGSYAGVIPGQNSKNPLPAAPTGSPRLIWTGFQSTPAGARVFLQTTGQVSYEIQEGKASASGHSTMLVVLRNCRIHMANNQRRLDTRAFPTPVQGFVAKQKRGDVELRISLRERATATPVAQAGPEGTQFVILDFPPGKAEAIDTPKRTDSTAEAEQPPADTAAQPEGKKRKAGKAAAQSRPELTGGPEPGSVRGASDTYVPADFRGMGGGIDETPAHTWNQVRPR